MIFWWIKTNRLSKGQTVPDKRGGEPPKSFKQELDYRAAVSTYMTIIVLIYLSKEKLQAFYAPTFSKTFYMSREVKLNKSFSTYNCLTISLLARSLARARYWALHVQYVTHSLNDWLFNADNQQKSWNTGIRNVKYIQKDLWNISKIFRTLNV